MKKTIIILISILMLSCISCSNTDSKQDTDSSNSTAIDSADDLTLDNVKEEINYNPN